MNDPKTNKPQEHQTKPETPVTEKGKEQKDMGRPNTPGQHTPGTGTEQTRQS